MDKILTPFERKLKESMSDYEMPYEQRSWFDLQKRMSSKSAGNYPWIVALIATCVVTATGSIALYRNRHTPSTAHIVITDARFKEAIAINSATQSMATDPATYSANTAPSISAITASSFNINNTPGQQLATANTNLSTLSGTEIPSTNAILAEDGAANPETKIAAPASDDKQIRFSSNVREACQGVEVEFNVTNGPSEGDYLWNFGDGHFDSEVNPKHKFAKAGRYDVQLSITSDRGQIRTTEMNYVITIHPSPDANFEWEFVNDLPQSPTVKIVNTSEDANSYEWTFADGTSSKQISPIVPFSEKGRQTIALSVSNEYGCTDGKLKQVSVNSDYNLGAQSTITAGREIFMPTGLKQSKSNFVLSVFDANGQKVFETSNRLKGWDGKLPGGSNAVAGDAYNWKVIIKNDTSKEEKYFNGTLTITP